MEQFIRDIEDFCAQTAMTPQRLLRASIDASWGQWDSWKARRAFPTARTMDRVRGYMAGHIQKTSEGDAA